MIKILLHSSFFDLCDKFIQQILPSRETYELINVNFLFSVNPHPLQFIKAKGKKMYRNTYDCVHYKNIKIVHIIKIYSSKQSISLFIKFIQGTIKTMSFQFE